MVAAIIVHRSVGIVDPPVPRHHVKGRTLGVRPEAVGEL